MHWKGWSRDSRGLLSSRIQPYRKAITGPKWDRYISWPGQAHRLQDFGEVENSLDTSVAVLEERSARISYYSRFRTMLF